MKTPKETLLLKTGQTCVIRSVEPEDAARMIAYMKIMLGETPYLIRTPEEYDEGHIPGAINVPNEEIGPEAPSALPDRDQLLLVYCRSGNRSKQAAEKLAALGYSRVVEFGGILDWKGEIVTETEGGA